MTNTDASNASATRGDDSNDDGLPARRWRDLLHPRKWLVLSLIGLVAFSEHLAFNRIFQVDELQHVFTARLLATHQTVDYFASANLMLLGPMEWLAGWIDQSKLLLRAERGLFFVLFWINLALIVRAAGIELRKTRGLLAFLLVATLAPLWDYGFEIRHENPLLTVILVAWIFARPLSPGCRRHLFLVGLLVVLGQFLAFKAFAYLVPIALFGLVAAAWERETPLWRSTGAFFLGALTGLVLGLSVHWIAGTFSFYWSDTKSLGNVFLSEPVRFDPYPTLARLPDQCPLLLVAVATALVVAFHRKDLRHFTSRESFLPEVALLSGAIAAIFANPTPYPYNLVLLVPQAALLALRLRPLRWFTQGFWRGALVLAFVFHMVTWFHATRRHFWFTNARQFELITAAEAMTDPDDHAVFDGAGLVPTRHPPGRFWLIHGFTIRAFHDGTLPPIRSQLAEGRTPVIILSYRSSWLPPEDFQFIKNHYVALAGDFLVAGRVVSPGTETEWTCLVPGRYYLGYDSSKGEVFLDDRPREPGIVLLEAGPHELRSNSKESASLVWLGPDLDVPPSLGPGDPERVFVNWY